jgi:hypothetical protein
MIHGIGLGGGALLALAALLFGMYLIGPRGGAVTPAHDRSAPLAAVAAVAAVMLWLTTLVGTYFVFPAYRATPPEGATDLTAYPRSFLLADASTAWLHAFAMETKEHLPFIASILATAVAFVAWRYRHRILTEDAFRRPSLTLLAISFVIVAYISLLGVFINKVAPLE